MLNLLSIEPDNRHWKTAKANRRKGIEWSSTLDFMTKPKRLRGQEKLRQCKSYIIQFRNHIKNFNPRDSKNSKNENKDEVVLPFESAIQFYRSIHVHIQI